MNKAKNIHARGAETAEEHSSSANTALGFAVLGCLVVGVVGIFRALTMDSGAGVFFCLLASILAFGAVAWIYLRGDS